MAFIEISDRVKPLLSDDDNFALHIDSIDRDASTITVSADGDLFLFKVLKSNTDDDELYDKLFSLNVTQITVTKWSDNKYTIAALSTEDCETAEYEPPQPGDVKEVDGESQDSAPVTSDTGVGAVTSGCNFRKLDKQVW